jgi:hypothetical protein
VAVNVRDHRTGVTLLNDEAIDAALASGAPAIELDVLPADRYHALVGSTVDRALVAAQALRDDWRRRPIGETADATRACLRQLGVVVALVLLAGRQRHDTSLLRTSGRLSGLAEQLRVSAFELDDIVRAMDDLHYDIVPALVALRAAVAAER